MWFHLANANGEKKKKKTVKDTLEGRLEQWLQSSVSISLLDIIRCTYETTLFNVKKEVPWQSI